MSDSAFFARAGRPIVIVVLALSLLVFALQLLVVRPRLWPAGAGVTLSGDVALASLSTSRALSPIRPPAISSLDERRIVVEQIRPAIAAPATGLTVGTPVARIASDRGTVELPLGNLPVQIWSALGEWRTAYNIGPTADVALTWGDPTPRSVTLSRTPVWAVDTGTQNEWLRMHAGTLLQMAAFLAGAIALVALGARGMTATLMTLALAATGIANGGPLYGAERSVPILGDILLLFSWLVTPLAFPIIGLAVMYFPSPSPLLERYRWLQPAILALALPMFAVSLLAAIFLLGVDVVVLPLAWLTAHGWIYNASFALALAANVLIVIEGIGRYRRNPDVNERRRIEIVVFTGVPAVFAYAIKVGVPLLSDLAGRPMQLPWAIEALLQAVILLPAFGLPYAVAVRHVFSPRTVLRRGLQYALARRTLSVVALLPIAALVVSVVREWHKPLGEIIVGQPLFLIICLGFALAGFRYRDRAQKWLDQRFFREEYDAREILVSLASRVPFESDPRDLVALVITQIDSALHPDFVAVLAGEGAQLEPVSDLRSDLGPLARSSGIVTLLRWSDEPLEVFLDDDRSPVARLPAADRAWLSASQTALLVPILAGTGEARSLVGLIALGQKRSEEPYTAEDRRLLSGIAAQMSVALDLSRLRRQASVAQTVAATAADGTATPTVMMTTDSGGAAALVACPVCRRCFDRRTLTADASGPARCPDDGSALEAVPGMPAVVDGKYRIDAVVGRGGMGAVFRARDMRLERDVAIKIVRSELIADPESRARFRREAQIVARLQHPAIVTVFDYGNLSDGAAFLVMEFVRGEDLRQLLRREKALPAARTLELITGIAMGVEAAHRTGVLHRDLKPENILLPVNGTGPKVLDFGLAKMTDATAIAGMMVTQGTTIIGTPAYMSPEQLRGDAVDERTDVFSLGVMTFEALTGGLPFGNGSFVEIGMRQAAGPDAERAADLPRRMAAAILRALALDPATRPASAADYVKELART